MTVYCFINLEEHLKRLIKYNTEPKVKCVNIYLLKHCTFRAVGTQCQSSSIVTPTRAELLPQKFQTTFPINYLAISGNFEQLYFFHFLTKFFLTQSSRELKHLRQSSRRSSGNNLQLVVVVQALDQREASIYRSRMLSTNSYCSKTIDKQTD